MPAAQFENSQRQDRRELVTLLFTDIVDSTALKQQLGDRAGAVLFEQHHQIVRHILAQFPRGKEIETAGDSFLIVFAIPSDAVHFALRLQARLRILQNQEGVAVLDRIGIHVGEVVIKEKSQKANDLYGIQIDICARVMSLAKARQILLTRPVFDSARQVLKREDIEGVSQLEWLNHGPYLLKGLANYGSAFSLLSAQRAKRHSLAHAVLKGLLPRANERARGRRLNNGGFQRLKVHAPLLLESTSLSMAI